MYDWLPQALRGRGTVVTANRRLARALRQEFAAQQLAAGIAAWETPAIFAWPDWLQVMLQDAGARDDLPTRINHHHSTLLWERCLRKELDDDVIGAGHIVRLARESHQRLADWDVGIREVARTAQGRDQQAFAVAAGRYLGLIEREGWVDDAGLATLLVARIRYGQVRPAGRFTFAGFDRSRPVIGKLRAQLTAAGCEVGDQPERPPVAPVLMTFDTPDIELRAAGAWARQHLDTEPSTRIGIVVPGLERDAQRFAGLVREGLLPGYRLANDVPAEALNVSYGRRLASYALVSMGLLWLRWLVRELRAPEVGHLLRSPLIGAGGMAGRARLELRLRGLPDRDWSPYMITAAMQGKEEDATDWLQRVAGLTKLRRELPASASPAEWAIRIDGILDAAGWPGVGSLSSADFQLLNRWRDLLNDLARMDLVSARMSLETALNQLESMAADAVFQPETELTQVHLLGPLEACGLEFDAIWLTGMTASEWPARGNASVLVSRRLQEEHGMPDATPEETLEHSRRLLGRLCAAAPEVVCSYPRVLEDAEQTVSELLNELGASPADAPPDPGWHAAQLAGADGLRSVDDAAPPIDGAERLVGGASTIQAQLSEPAAAFIGGRLAARALDEQASGLPALLRGNLIHDALYKLYLDKPSRDDVAAWTDVDARIAAAVDFAFARHERNADTVLTQLLRMERQRVAGLLREFLRVDVARGPFVVDSVERKVDFAEDGVRLELRIDRIDRLPDGSVAIIDYKTGAEKTFLTRQGEPKEYQLVAYACALDETVAALALANVDSRSVVFHGVHASDTQDWSDALARWSDTVRIACAEITRGDVRLDRRQSADDARALNLLTRFTERRNEW